MCFIFLILCIICLLHPIERMMPKFLLRAVGCKIRGQAPAKLILAEKPQLTLQTLFTLWCTMQLHYSYVLRTRSRKTSTISANTIHSMVCIRTSLLLHITDQKHTCVFYTKTHTPFVPPHFTHKNSFVSIAILQKHYTALLHILHLNCVTSLLDLQVPVPVYCSAVDYKFLYHTW